MIQKMSRYKGFASFDALASLVPILLVLLILWQTSISMAKASNDVMDNQQRFNKLVSIADYTVKSGAVMRDENIRYPNWIDEGLLTESYADSLMEQTDLETLHIGMQAEGGMCIYRLVVSGQEKTIKRLFVCGG